MKAFLIFVLISFFYATTFAQEKFGGQIFEKSIKTPLPGIGVENLTSHAKAVSGADGTFVISAKIGDLISFSGFSYRPDTLYIKDLEYLRVYLVLKNKMLHEVQVTTPEIKTGNLVAPPIRGPFGSQRVLYQTDDSGNYIGGIKIMLYDWDKDEKKKIRDRQFIIDESEKLDIAKIFNPQNIQNYLPLKGHELQNFIVLYIPNLQTYRSNDFNLLLYLTKSYKEFKKIPKQKRQSEDYLTLVYKK